MPEPIAITEVVGRSEQGMTRPFVCRAGSQTYYVKGAYAGLNSLCCEWVAGRLAKLLLPDGQLSVPEINFADAPEALLSESARLDIRDLGEGLVFASRQVEQGQDLNWLDAQGWLEGTMAELLLLDLWLQNEDRSLSSHGGNPNLLVTRLAQANEYAGKSQRIQDKLWAYDFNLAFDEDFQRARFFALHVFGGRLKAWPEGFRERMAPRMRWAIGELDAIFAELPPEWLRLDGDETLPVQLSKQMVASALALPFEAPDTFWELP